MAAASSNPDFQKALTLAHGGNFAEAAAQFGVVMESAPSADAACNLAYCLRRLDRTQEALAALERALSIDPNHAAALLNMGSLLISCDRLDEAETLLRRGVSVYGKDASLHINLASCLFHLGRYSDAQKVIEKALTLAPDNPHAHHTLANIMLLSGRLVDGFKHYEWRIACGDAALAVDGERLGIPRWQGESLAGKTLLAVTEQGLGDTLNFVRYGSMVQACGGRMIVTCTAALRRLLAAAPCVDGLLSNGDPKPVVDFHAPLLSLPHLFGTTMASVPRHTPYLNVREEWKAEWAPRLGERKRLRVGLVWSGSPTHKNDRNRSLPLPMLEPLLTSDQVECFALQVGMSEQDRQYLDGFPEIRRPGAEITDYADTAAILSQMDLLLTVDTSSAHLAGALGVPVWVMLPAVPDWRWMLYREDSPWYPSLRLFRQSQPGDWPGVLAAVQTALSQLAQSGSRGRRG